MVRMVMVSMDLLVFFPYQFVELNSMIQMDFPFHRADNYKLDYD